MDLLHQHMIENVGKVKGISEDFRVEEGSSSSYSKGRIDVGIVKGKIRVSTYAIYNEVEIKVGTITERKSNRDTINIGMNNVIIWEERMTLKNTTTTWIRAQNRKWV